MSEQYRVTIPANIERPDVIVGSFTARQLAILVPAAAAVWLGYQATRTLLPLPVAAGFAVVVLGAAAALALAERDGVGLDRLLVFALMQHRQPRVLVPAQEEAPPLPGWAAAGGSKGQAAGQAAPLRLPVRAIGPDGVLDLGGEGVAAVVACTTVSFGLRTADEQAGLVGVFAAWLNSLSGPVQILVRAQPIDLHPAIDDLRHHAGGLPHPALEEAALDHAGYLADLAASRQLLARQVSSRAARGDPPVRHHRRDGRHGWTRPGCGGRGHAGRAARRADRPRVVGRRDHRTSAGRRPRGRCAGAGGRPDRAADATGHGGTGGSNHGHTPRCRS